MLGGDFALAEEVVQEAFAAALEQWPTRGAPRYPRAWLIQTAQHKAIDRLRRTRRFEAPLEDAALQALEAEAAQASSEDDDYLRLIFTCCHPALALEAQVALTLHTLCGLSTEEIARAFLTSPVTMAQRLVRAKNKIKVAKIPYVVPERAELGERLDGVLGVIYLVFNEGYAATSGDAWIRRDLTTEAIRLGRLVERVLPERSEPVVQQHQGHERGHGHHAAALPDYERALALASNEPERRYVRRRIAESMRALTGGGC